MCTSRVKQAVRKAFSLPKLLKGLLLLGIFVVLFLSSSLLLRLLDQVREGEEDSPKSLGRQGIKRSSPNKILCYVLLSPAKLVEGKTIKETWGSRCDKLIFYGRFNNSQLPVTYLNVSEGYRFLWGKTQAALLQLNASYSETYQWFLKADDDTFVVLENLRHFVKTLNSSQAIWFGYKLKHPQLTKGFMSGGAGYVFSRASLREITSLLKGGIPKHTHVKCRAGATIGLEDLELAAGIQDIPTADEKGRERFLAVPIESLWSKKIPAFHWLWRQAWNPLKIGSDCCSSQIISTHQISPAKMKEMYDILYGKKKSQHPRIDIHL